MLSCMQCERSIEYWALYYLFEADFFRWYFVWTRCNPRKPKIPIKPFLYTFSVFRMWNFVAVPMTYTHIDRPAVHSIGTRQRKNNKHHIRQALENSQQLMILLLLTNIRLMWIYNNDDDSITVLWIFFLF